MFVIASGKTSKAIKLLDVCQFAEAFLKEKKARKWITFELLLSKHKSIKNKKAQSRLRFFSLSLKVSFNDSRFYCKTFENLETFISRFRSRSSSLGRFFVLTFKRVLGLFQDQNKSWASCIISYILIINF